MQHTNSLGTKRSSKGDEFQGKWKQPCLGPAACMSRELASRNASSDFNHTSGKSEPVGLEGAGRNPETVPHPA